MKNTLLFFIVLLLLSACTVTIPMQNNIDDTVLLLTENRDIKANYTLLSNVKDGKIKYVKELMDGTQTVDSFTYQYASETSFKNVWKNYFETKFNQFSKNEINVKIKLEDIYIKVKASNTVGEQLLTGNTKVMMSATMIINYEIYYKGKEYKNKYKITESDYNESQSGRYATYYQTNPTMQKAQLIEKCLNKSIIYFNNAFKNIEN